MVIDEKLKRDAETAFIRARIHLLQHHPFLAHLAMKLKLEWLENVPHGLSATDGTHLFINPEAFTKLSKGAQVTCLVHETLHCAWGHLSRRGGRDTQKWNMAADIKIDDMIHAERFEAGPWEQSRDQWLKQHKLSLSTFEKMDAEAVYEKLPAMPPQMSCGCGGNGQGGCFREAPSKAEEAEMEAKWRQNVVEAGQLAGAQAGHWSELVKAAMPRPPFQVKLLDYLSRGLGGDNTWDLLSRRQIYRGLYLPTDTRMVMGRTVWVTDTSGSMSQPQLAKAFGYFRGFREQHPCIADLICCDYDVASHQTYQEWERLPESFEARGRGGTSFDAPFNLLREKRIEPRLLVYASDLYGTCSVPKPRYPVMWLCIGGDQSWKAPFGEICHVTA